MKWTVEKANKMLEELKIQKKATESNLSEIAKLIRRKLRKQGKSIKMEGGILRETKKVRAARERKEATIPKRSKIEGPIGVMIAFIDNLELDVIVRTPLLIEIGGVNKAMAKEINSKAKSLGLLVESDETGWFRIRKEEKGRLDQVLVREAYRRAGNPGKAYIIRQLAAKGFGPNRAGTYLDESRFTIEELSKRHVKDDEESAKTLERLFI